MVLKQKFRKSLIHCAYTLNVPFAKRFLSRYITEYDQIRQSFLVRHGINVVFDVGANIGQYAKSLQHGGYKGRIISFEPLNDTRAILEQSTRLFPNWDLLPYALGDANEKATINIAGNTASSSVLKMNENHQVAAPESRYIGTQEIEIKTLDTIYHTYVTEKDNVFLKIDTQGYELKVLEGGATILPHVKGLELEMSFEQLYENETTFITLYQYLYERGFRIFHIKPMLRDPKTLQLLQADCIFFRV